ncbi:MAG: sulfatase [Planctomycetota bacterium]
MKSGNRPQTAPWAALGLALALGACGGDGPAPPPSIVLISLDTLRADHTGFLGYGRDTTPNLDRLAQEGVVFERAFATSCWTLTSHMGMLTGLYPEQHGVVSANAALNPKVPLLAERLRQRGYTTMALFEFGWIHERHGFDRGFDVFRPHRDAEQAEQHLAEELGRLEGDRPFFLFLHLFDIHCDPLLAEDGVFYDPPEPFDRRYREDAPEALRGIDFKQALAEPGVLDADQLDALVAMYDGGIRYADGKVGAWLADWRERGLLDRAVLFVTADHGEALGQRAGELDEHGGMYQEGLRVPLLVRFPDGRHAGERRTHAVNSVDLVPTVLELAGAEPDPRLPGYPLFGSRPADSVMAAMLGDDFALMQWPWKVRGSGQDVVLYELERDPGETRPIPVASPEGSRAYGAMHNDFRRERDGLAPLEAPAGTATQMTQEALEMLRAIGYAGHLEEDG